MHAGVEQVLVVACDLGCEFEATDESDLNGTHRKCYEFIIYEGMG